MSDAERDEVIDILRQHTADGRLRMDEFEERVTEALAARTRADLEPALRELPPLVSSPPPPRGQSRAMAWTSVVNGRVLVAAAAVVLATVLFAQGVWWIVFPLIAVFGGCGGSRACTRGWADTASKSGETAADDRDTIRV